MMKEWALYSSYEFDGRASFMMYYFDTEQECIDKAEQEWAEFYSIKKSKKFMLCRYQNKKQTIKRQVVCDSVGHCKTKNNFNE